jgi:hypothetical protein
MTRFFSARGVILGIAFAAGLCALITCQPPVLTNSSHLEASPSSSAAQAESRAKNGRVRDLSQDESAGGHILRKHVGQTDDQLRERLQKEPHITGASTYTDRATAEQAVGAAIAQSQDRIQRWLNRSGGHPNLVLDYDSGAPIGRTINRGDGQSHPCSHALLVLQYAGPNDYYVLTSYPECR